MLGEEAGTRSPGFTVLEMLATLGLAAILAGTGAVQLIELVRTARLASGARTVASLLRLARGRALASNVEVEVVFDAPGASCNVRQAATLIETRALPVGVTFAGLPARGRILFRALGSAENGTVRLASGLRTRSVIVNQRGRVRLQ